MNVALTNWHKVIPEYALREDATPKAYWGNVHGIFSLPLEKFGP